MAQRLVRFYTMAPRGVYHPYLLVNAGEGWSSPWKYKSLFRRKFKHAILDAGVELFLRNPNVSDYPSLFLERYKRLAVQLTSAMKGRLWVAVPDFPDDYHPGQAGDNIGKTLSKIREFVPLPNVEWMPVLQSRYLDRLSFYESCARTREVVGDYPRLGIGTVCKTHNQEFILECCRIARKFFPSSRLHAFGPSLSVVPKIAPFIDSWDSSAWTFPRARGRTSANTSEYPEFFAAYLERIRRLLGDGVDLTGDGDEA